jgi:ABC-type transport system involved in multi-copper enzyme maturation permease subunit
MSKLRVILKREFLSYLNSPAAYVFVVIFLLMSGFYRDGAGESSSLFSLVSVALSSFDPCCGNAIVVG